MLQFLFQFIYNLFILLIFYKLSNQRFFRYFIVNSCKIRNNILLYLNLRSVSTRQYISSMFNTSNFNINSIIYVRIKYK